MSSRVQSLACLGVFAALSAGCAVVTTDDSGAVRLPTGATLLESDRSSCEGAVALEDDFIRRSGRADLVIQRGGNATFELDADEDDDVEIDWTCVGAADTERDTVECPEATTYLRITRSNEDEFLFECYGDSDRAVTRARR